MASTQLTASSISGNGFASFEGLRSTCIVKTVSFAPLKHNNSRSFSRLVVKAATTVAPKVSKFPIVFEITAFISPIGCFTDLSWLC